MFDLSKIVETLEAGVKFIEDLTPIATAIGGPIVGNVSNTVLTVTDIAHNALSRAAEIGHVFSDEDQADINAIINRLAVQNDKLAEAIRNS